jgi:hypothetical protein
LPRIIKAGGTLGVPSAKFATYGTLAAGVSDAWGNIYALSCSHVVAAPINGNATGVPVESPAAMGQQPGSQPIGTVQAWVPLGPGDNFVDAGLVRLDLSKVRVSNSELALTVSQEAIHKQVLEFASFSGRSALIHSHRGTLRGIVGHLFDHKLFGFAGRDYSFSNILSYLATADRFEEGDSGSAVTEEESGQFLGIHFAADDGNRTGYCILASLVWSSFVDYGLQMAE